MLIHTSSRDSMQGGPIRTTTWSTLKLWRLRLSIRTTTWSTLKLWRLRTELKDWGVFKDERGLMSSVFFCPFPSVHLFMQRICMWLRKVLWLRTLEELCIYWSYWYWLIWCFLITLKAFTPPLSFSSLSPVSLFSPSLPSSLPRSFWSDVPPAHHSFSHVFL